MAKLYNLARMTTPTTGTGTITLGAAVAGHITFAAAGLQDGDKVSYAIIDGAAIEIGRGTYNISGPTLTRSALQSTDNNAPLNLSGSAEVYITEVGGGNNFDDFQARIYAAVAALRAELVAAGVLDTSIKFFLGEIGTVDASTVAVRFSRTVQATNAGTGATIRVNGSGATISGATIQADKHDVYYRLAAPVGYGDVVTWSYNGLVGNIQDEATGAPLASVTAQTITNNLWKPRLAMWVWAYDLKTKANCDAMIAWATGRMTDLYVFAIDDSVTPRTWLGTGTLGTSNATTIDGKTPWKYVYDAVHAVGIRMHAWMWTSYFPYIGGVNGLDPSIPNDATYNDTNVWNFHSATARQKLVDEIADFCANNPVDGINWNHEATTPLITEQDMTDFMTAMRAAVSNIEFSFCVGATTFADALFKINTPAWITAGLIDSIVMMGYYDNEQTKLNYTNSLPPLAIRNLITGVGAELNYVIASDMRHKWRMLLNDGYRNFAIFCWGDSLNDDAALRDAVDQYLGVGLNTTQGDITKVSVTPGTSFTVTVGGVDQTTLYSAVTDHLYSGPLKKHVEAAVGSENPAIIYNREGATSTLLLVGDFQP